MAPRVRVPAVGLSHALFLQRAGWICLRLALPPPLRQHTPRTQSDAASFRIRATGSSLISSGKIQGSWIPLSPCSGSTSLSRRSPHCPSGLVPPAYAPLRRRVLRCLVTFPHLQPFCILCPCYLFMASFDTELVSNLISHLYLNSLFFPSSLPSSHFFL